MKLLEKLKNSNLNNVIKHIELSDDWWEKEKQLIKKMKKEDAEFKERTRMSPEKYHREFTI